jgi:hypothetical protein
MNFMRGRQMVIHDPRLNWPGNPTATPPIAPIPLRPPSAIQTWTVTTSDPTAHILGWAGEVASAGTLDALHLMAHGNRNYMQIGSDNIHWNNLNNFLPLKGKVRFIIFWSCLVGGASSYTWRHPPNFGARIAEITNARVLMATENQLYSKNAANVIDFGPWEGEVYVFQPNGDADVHQSYNPFRYVPQLMVENLIFGS